MRSASSAREVATGEPAVPLASRLVLLRGRPATQRWNLLELWHLLSLDAPLVALVWTAFFARSAGVQLPWIEPVAMFVAVWLLYACDRLLDARPLASGALPPGLEERHHFHHRHRAAFLLMTGVACGLLIALLTRMDAETLRWEAVLALALGLWLLMIHAGAARRAGADHLPKEFAVGIFFGAATVVPSALRSLQPLSLLVPAGLFAGVCALNCVLLYRWEHEPAVSSSARTRDGHASTRWAADRIALLGGGLLLLCCGALTAAHRQLIVACLLATLGLLGLDWLHSRRSLRRVTQRALADLALLTPLLLWAWR